MSYGRESRGQHLAWLWPPLKGKADLEDRYTGQYVTLVASTLVDFLTAPLSSVSLTQNT